MSLLMLPVLTGTSGIQDAEICRACGGQCCKNAAGITWPSEFGPRETMAQVIAEYLRTGFWAVDCWEGDINKRAKKPLSQIWYVRPAHKNAVGKIVDCSWGGECRLLTDIGCSLDFRHRPRQCRELIPHRDSENCVGPSGLESKEAYIREWRKYQRELIEAMNLAGVQ